MSASPPPSGEATAFVGRVNVHVMWGRDFYQGPEGKTDEAASPYVVLRYKGKKVRTAVAQKQAEPYFDESFSFDLADGAEQVLSIEVRDKKTLRGRVFGVAGVDLRKVLSPHGVEDWFTLGPRPSKPDASFRGAVYLAVSFSKFVVRVEKAIDLVPPGRQATSAVLPGSPSGDTLDDSAAGSRNTYALVRYASAKRKTKVVPGSRSPAYGQTFHFPYAIGAPFFELEIWAKGRLTDSFLGRATVFLNDFKNGEVDNSWYTLLPRTDSEPVTGRINLLVQAFTVPQDLVVQYDPVAPFFPGDASLFEAIEHRVPPDASDSSPPPPSPPAAPPAASDTRFRSSHPSLWTLDDIHAWLFSLGMERFYKAFVKHEIDGEALVHLSTLEIATGLNVPMGPAKKFFLAVQDAKVAYATRTQANSAIATSAAAAAAAFALSPPPRRRPSLAATKPLPRLPKAARPAPPPAPGSDSGSLKFDSDSDSAHPPASSCPSAPADSDSDSSSFWSSSDDDAAPPALTAVQVEPMDAPGASSNAGSADASEDDSGRSAAGGRVGGAVALNVMSARDLVDPDAVSEDKMTTYVVVRYGSSKMKAASPAASFAPTYEGKFWVALEDGSKGKAAPAEITFEIYRSKTLTSSLLGRAVLPVSELPTDGSIFDAWLDVVPPSAAVEVRGDGNNDSDDECDDDDAGASTRDDDGDVEGRSGGALHVHGILSFLSVGILAARGLGAGTDRDSHRVFAVATYAEAVVAETPTVEYASGAREPVDGWETRTEVCFKPGAPYLSIDVWHRASLSNTHLGMIKIPLERFGNGERRGWYSLVRRRDGEPVLDPDTTQVLVAIRAVALPPFLRAAKTLVVHDDDSDDDEPELLEAFGGDDDADIDAAAALAAARLGVASPPATRQLAKAESAPALRSKAGSASSNASSGPARGRSHSRHRNRYRKRGRRSFWDW